MKQILKQALDLQEKISELGSVVTELEFSLSFMNEEKVDTQVFADFKEELNGLFRLPVKWIKKLPNPKLNVPLKPNCISNVMISTFTL